MVQVTIIGAGLIGASIAWRLSQSGCAVTLIDAGAFGGETSSAGAGMLSPGTEFETPSIWSSLGVESMAMYPEFVDELRVESGVAIDFQICGCKKISEETGESQFFPNDGLVDPNHLLKALRAVCNARAVKIVENRSTSAVEMHDFDKLVIAAGAWSNQINLTHNGARLDLPTVKPIKGHLIGFDMQPGTLGPMIRHGHSYVLQRSNGFTIAGSTEEDVGFDRTIDGRICDDIHQRTAQLWPKLAAAQPSKRWIGFRPYSEVPRIGRFGDTNAWLAYGHFRNGILLTPLTAQRIASEISGK
jgi:glycine oxidase